MKSAVAALFREPCSGAGLANLCKIGHIRILRAAPAGLAAAHFAAISTSAQAGGQAAISALLARLRKANVITARCQLEIFDHLVMGDRSKNEQVLAPAQHS
jgi:hypothetical protein